MPEPEFRRPRRHGAAQASRRHRERQARERAEQALAAAQTELAGLHQQAEQQRAVSAAQLNLLLQTLPTAVLAETSDRRIAFSNPQLGDLLGLSAPAALLGQPTTEALVRAANPPRDQAAFAAWQAQTVAAHRPVPPAAFELTDGRMVQLHYLPLHQGPAVALHLWNYEDVTIQHRAQQRIQQLSALAEHSPQPILTADAQGLIRYHNPAAEALRPAFEDASDAGAWLRRQVAATLLDARPRTVEHALAGHFFLWTVAPLPTQAAANVYLTDISVRRRAEAELRRSQHLLARINDTLPTLVFVYDLEQQRVRYANDQAGPLLGWQPAELLGSTPAELRALLHSADWPALRPILRAGRELGEAELLTAEVRVRHRSGTWRWLRLQLLVFERDAAGRPRQLVGSGEDVTEQRAAEEERRRARARAAEQGRLLRQVIDAVPHLVYLRDETGRYVLANQATANLLGRPLRELPGRRATDLLADPAGWQLSAFEADSPASLTGPPEEVTLRRPDGEPLYFLRIRRPFVRADGTVLELGVDSNITALKRAQLALAAAKEAAEENARVKQDFLANMSHEVRTPLHGILGLAALLARGALTAEQARHLALLRQSADHLLVLIDDLLAAAQLGSGKLRLERIAFDVYALLRDTLVGQQPRATEKGLALRLELPAGPAPRWVLGDPHRLRQVVLNLLGNALKFTAQGEVTLRAAWVSPDADTPRLHLSVTDTGIGIAPELVERIFEPFTQASASTAREFGGSGLGLSISRDLVALLGGRIWAESQPGRGSTFHVELPLPPAPPEAAARPAASAAEAPAALPPCRVLLVEDNPVNQLVAATMLRGWGATVDTADGGLAALALFAEHRYDLVLMDIQMPGLDGPTAAERMRQHPDAARARTPIIALTAHALPGEAERYRQAGFAGYVPKPFGEAQLLAVLRQVLGAPPTLGTPQAPPLALAAESAAPAYGRAAPVDLAPLRRLAGHDAALLRRLAGLFVRSTPPVLDRLQAHLAEQNWVALAEEAHFLKSSVNGVGLHALLPALRELEALGQPGAAPAPDRVQALVAQVSTAFADVVAQLRREYLAD